MKAPVGCDIRLRHTGGKTQNGDTIFEFRLGRFAPVNELQEGESITALEGCDSWEWEDKLSMEDAAEAVLEAAADVDSTAVYEHQELTASFNASIGRLREAVKALREIEDDA